MCLIKVIHQIGQKEVFTVYKTQYTNPITYKLQDLNDKEIQGSFYEPEY